MVGWKYLQHLVILRGYDSAVIVWKWKNKNFSSNDLLNLFLSPLLASQQLQMSSKLLAEGKLFVWFPKAKNSLFCFASNEMHKYKYERINMLLAGDQYSEEQREVNANNNTLLWLILNDWRTTTINGSGKRIQIRKWIKRERERQKIIIKVQITPTSSWCA